MPGTAEGRLGAPTPLDGTSLAYRVHGSALSGLAAWGGSGGSVANPYVRLGGTLDSPRLEVKPLTAVASTGAAVATVGMTIVYRGIYSRITAEKKVRVDALAESRKAEGDRAARKSANPGE